MSEIIMILNPEDIADLISGKEIEISPSVRKFDNLQKLRIKLDKEKFDVARLYPHPFDKKRGWM